MIKPIDLPILHSLVYQINLWLLILHNVPDVLRSNYKRIRVFVMCIISKANFAKLKLTLTSKDGEI